MNIYIVKTTSPTNASLSGNSLCRTMATQIRRAASLAVALGTTVVLATGCSSTETGFDARLISPVPTNRQPTHWPDDNWYQPARSPSFDSDLFGS